MRVVARGWNRDCGESVVLQADLEDGYERSLGPTDTYKSGKLYVRRRANGDVQVSKGPSTMTLGGKYQVSLSLTKAEILQLFMEAHRFDKFADVMIELGGAFAAANEEDDGDDTL